MATGLVMVAMEIENWKILLSISVNSFLQQLNVLVVVWYYDSVYSQVVHYALQIFIIKPGESF